MVLGSVSVDQDVKKSVLDFGFKNPDQSIELFSKMFFFFFLMGIYNLCCHFQLKDMLMWEFYLFHFSGFGPGCRSKITIKWGLCFKMLGNHGSIMLKTLCPSPTLPTGFLNFSQVQVIGADPPKLPNSSTFSPALIFRSPENCRN